MAYNGDPLTSNLADGDKLVESSRYSVLFNVVLLSLLPCAFGLLVAVLLLPAVRQNEATERWTEHTHQVLAGIAAILVNADDAETGQRGFLLTNDARLLEPFDNGTKNIWVNFLNVQSLTEDNADQQSRLQVLHGFLDDKLAELSRTIELARTHNIDAAVEVVRGGQGKVLMDDIRRSTADMASEEERLLLIRSTASASAQRWSTILLVFFGCFSVLIGGIAIVFASVAARSKRRSVAIASERQRLLSMLDFAPIMMRDISGIVRFWSEGCQRLYGWTAEQAVGEPAYQLLQTVGSESSSDMEAILVQKGEWSGELRQRTQNGTEIIVVSNKILLMGSDGNRWGVKETLTDITSLRRVEAALHASQAQFRAVVNSAGDAIIIARSDGAIQSVNPAALGMFGYDRIEELIGRDLATLMSGTEAARHGNYVANHQAGAPPRVIGIPGRELLAMRRDGSEFPIDLTVSSFEIDGNYFLTGIIRDISDRKRAETTLRASEARLRRFVDDAPAAIAMLDTDMRYLAASRRYIASRFSISDHQIDPQVTSIVGHCHYDLFPSANSRRAIHDRVFAGDTTSGEADPYQLADGSIAFVRWEMNPWRRTDGTIGGAMVFLEDETDRKIAELALHDSESRLRLVQEVGGIAYTDRTLPEPAALISSEFADIYGLPPGTTRVLVADIIARVHPDDQDRISAITPNSLEHGGKFAAEFRICRPDGAVRWINMRTEAFLGPTGLPNRIVSAQRDVTEIVADREALALRHEELKRLSQHLTDARDQADQANRAKSRFLASITHDLRTPLHGILGYVELLFLDGGLSSTQSQRLEAMMASGQYLLGTINSVLDMSEIEADRVELRPVEINLHEFVRTCFDVVRPKAEAKGLALMLAPAAAPLRLYADSTRLQQVVINLLGNAVKFTRTGSVEVRMQTLTAMGGIRLEVTDTGPGIDERHRNKLFQPFERLNAEAVSGIEGAGMGLAIAARLVRLMGGQIGYADNPGGGSVLWVELPRGAMPSEEVAIAASPPLARMPRLRVLIADDEAMNRSIASGFLRDTGHEVVCVDNGAAALEAATSGGLDVILMDVRMPGMDGLEATRRIRALPPPRGNVRVVAVTAHAFAQQIAACRLAGMDGHLAKPFKQAALLAELEKVIIERRVVPPSAATAGAAPRLPIFDRTVFGEIAELLPAADLEEHLTTVITRAETLISKLTMPEMLLHARELAEAAHKFAGGAGTLGFLAVAAAAREFEVAADMDAPETAALAGRLAIEIKASMPVVRQELVATAVVMK